MVIVFAKELLCRASEIVSDGHDLVEISENEKTENDNGCLFFSTIDEECGYGCDYDEVCDYSDAEGTLDITMDSFAPFPVTYNDLLLMKNALSDAIDNCKDCIKLRPEHKDDIRAEIIKYENYMAKVQGVLKVFHVQQKKL